MPVRTASARWLGGLQTGTGVVSSQSGALRDAPYSFRSRMQDGPGSNPEELLGAAHAGCFSMAFAHALESAGHTPDDVSTSVRVHFEQKDGGFSITLIELDTTAKVAGIAEADFQRIANEARDGCPVSRLFTGAELRLVARKA
jgi:lipoyl-dependent peroxiredoxin